jgi:predicted GNAT family acetyltransferase
MPQQTEPKNDEKLDETLADSFPASDPPANTVQTGVGSGSGSGSSNTPGIRDNRAESRFELTRDGQTAILVYERTAKSFVLVHTEVPPALRGHHLGEALVKAGVEAARAEGLSFIATCPFAREYLRKHPS